VIINRFQYRRPSNQRTTRQVERLIMLPSSELLALPAKRSADSKKPRLVPLRRRINRYL
jgi:hypothetical protein